jgi:plastin-1
MREHVIQTLKVLSKDGKELNDAGMSALVFMIDIIKWANTTVKNSGKSTQMKNMQDSSLKTSVFFCDLLNALSPGIVDYELVTNGKSDENAKLNAMYAISIARKLGATIFVLPEDIIEVKAKMILTFVGTLMALDRRGIAPRRGSS